ncbi:helix-hairpin-helix domain-containing protein [Suttonella sp. R2A3]|uniref:helix-hairpin-helix domain-containing protein n=1 Tax=Suttonella sp. R2A3 TaxID=2908648 RepID=UPI001F2BA125|nr:helix-hairpin-helix domain-containing protein [Suttonella sp. R2A3]UJF25383.1 helix-hairpin-helix domain-containing protein [Suttonella sp. R2A3]
MTRFNPQERKQLLGIKGIGETVVKRLEMMGFDSLESLAQADVDSILYQGSVITQSSCWQNSPQARAAINAALAYAKQHT